MGKKQKVSASSRQSAIILAKKKSFDGSLKAISSKDTPKKVESASSSSSLVRKDASSTSSKEFQEVFNALESSHTFKEHLDAQSKAKVDLIRKLSCTSRSSPSPTSKIEVGLHKKNMETELAQHLFHSPTSCHSSSFGHGDLNKEEEDLADHTLTNGLLPPVNSNILGTMPRTKEHGSTFSAPSKQNLTTHSSKVHFKSDSNDLGLKARDALEDFPFLEVSNFKCSSTGPPKPSQPTFLNDMDANEALNATQAQASL